MQAFDVIVVGGGIVGASFALALAQADLSVAIVSSQVPPSVPDDSPWDSRVYALSPGNAAWLSELQVWDRIPLDRLARIEAMRVYGDRAGSRLEFSAYDAGLRELAYIVENPILQSALWNALDEAAHITLCRPARGERIDWARDSAHITLDDGSRLSAALIVGADGADSWLRAQAGIAATLREYGQTAVVANFACERPHDETAFQWFSSEGVLALLPLPGRRASMVWSASQARARELLRASPAKLCAEVRAASNDMLGVLDLITPAAGFPLKRQRALRIVEPRAALIGDAAHNVHPLAGQGMNLGLRDARDLARVLRQRGAQSDCGDYALLRRYERARKEDVLALEMTTHGLEKLFSAPAVWIAGLRNLGLTLTDAQPLIKRALVSRAVA